MSKFKEGEETGIMDLRSFCSCLKLMETWRKERNEVNGAGRIRTERLRKQQYKKDYARAFKSVIKLVITSKCGNG